MSYADDCRAKAKAAEQAREKAYCDSIRAQNQIDAKPPRNTPQAKKIAHILGNAPAPTGEVISRSRARVLMGLPESKSKKDVADSSDGDTEEELREKLDASNKKLEELEERLASIRDRVDPGEEDEEDDEEIDPTRRVDPSEKRKASGKPGIGFRAQAGESYADYFSRTGSVSPDLINQARRLGL